MRAYEGAANAPKLYGPQLFDYSLDYAVLAYVIAISIGTGLLFGLTPALRLSKLDVNTALKEGGRGSTGGRRGKQLSASLLIGEMALAVVLLAGAGVMMRSFLNVYTADVGANTENVLTMFLALPEGKYSRAESQIAFFERLTTRVQALPGVESAAIAWRPPTSGSLSLPYELAGAPPVDEGRRPTLSALVVSPASFNTLGGAVLAGRDFTDADGASGMPTRDVNQRFASCIGRTGSSRSTPSNVRGRIAGRLATVGASCRTSCRTATAGIRSAGVLAYRQTSDPGHVGLRANACAPQSGAAFRHESRRWMPTLPSGSGRSR